MKLSFGLILCYTLIMKQSISVARKRGRPSTGTTPHVGARFPEALIAEIDVWAKANDISRSEAIRQLVEMGLKGKR